MSIEHQSVHKMLDHYKKYLEIQDDDLDNEVAQFPALFFTVSEYYADACEMRDNSKDDLEAWTGKFRENLRKRYEVREEKYSEKRLDKEAESNPKYRKKRKRYLELKYLAERWGMLRDAYLQKSFMLRNSVRLYFDSIAHDDAVKGTESERETVKNAEAQEGRKHMAAVRRNKEKGRSKGGKLKKRKNKEG